MPKKSKSSRSLKGRRGPVAVQALSLSESWDKALSVNRSSQTCRIQDRLINFGTTSGATVLNVTVLVGVNGSVGSLGQRVYQIGQAFEQWRLNRLLVRVTAVPISGGFTPAFAVSDDPINEGPAFSRALMAELRCARIPTVGTDSATLELMWTPVVRNRWYYTITDSPTPGAEDLRQCSPCQVTMQDVTSTATEFSIYYDITFKGQRNPSSSA